VPSPGARRLVGDGRILLSKSAPVDDEGGRFQNLIREQ
jgi:hypothetical protein